MVWAALVNLGLIVFDLTYLWMRPTYLGYLPALPAVYDQVKGIEPDPATSELTREISRAAELVQNDQPSSELTEVRDKIVELTTRVLTHNPFERSGQTRTLDLLRIHISQQTGQELTAATPDATVPRGSPESVHGGRYCGSADFERRWAGRSIIG